MEADPTFSMIEPSCQSALKVIPAMKALIDSEPPENGAPVETVLSEGTVACSQRLTPTERLAS